MENKQVWVAAYHHKYGTDIRVFAKHEDAEKWSDEIATEWWDHEFPDEEMPTEKVGDAYFRFMWEHPEPESFTIEKCNVE